MQINIEQGVDKIDAFLAKFETYLKQEVAKNNLLLGMLYGSKKGKYEEVNLISVTDGDEVKLLAVQTPPKGFVTNVDADKDAVELFIKTVESRDFIIPTFMASRENIPHIINNSAYEYRENSSCFIYELKEVLMPKGVKGSLEYVTEDDIELAAKWKYDFHIEVMPAEEHITTDQAVEKVKKNIDNKEICFWMVDGKPVSYISFNSLGYMGRISNVYTPKEFRKNGYASAMVGTVCQKMLDEGVAACCLFADANYPISNKVYQAIGFKLVCDMCTYIKK